MYGKRCHKKGIVRICEKKLHRGSIFGQIQGFWPMWGIIRVSTRSNDEILPYELWISILSCITSVAKQKYVNAQAHACEGKGHRVLKHFLEQYNPQCKTTQKSVYNNLNNLCRKIIPFHYFALYLSIFH